MIDRIKKYTLITFIALILLSMIFFIGLLVSGSGISVARYLPSDTGNHLMVTDGGPTVLHSNNEKMFKKLKAGDKIFVIHGGTNLSYPASTGAYFCMKLSNGEATDIPKRHMLELYDMNWIGEDKSSFPYEFRRANYQASLASMTVTMFDTWEYEYVSAETLVDPFGIAFWPKDASTGRIELLCYPGGYHPKSNNVVYTEEIELNGFEATIGYDADHNWLYIHFSGMYSNYAIQKDSIDSWTDEQLEDLKYILNKIDFPYVVVS